MLSQLPFFSNKKRKETSEGVSKYKVTAILSPTSVEKTSNGSLKSGSLDKKSIDSMIVKTKEKDHENGKSSRKSDESLIAKTEISLLSDPSESKENGPNNSDLCNDVNKTSDNLTTMARLSFHCQLAHGSPVKVITGFSNVKNLYERISSAFGISVNEVLFCTLNTHKIDMDRLLSGHIGLEDFIFVHCKGQTKEVEITKNEELLGLTITDNGNGYSFIKKIKEKSLIDSIKFVSIGDVIDKIDGISCIGKRHFEVAKALKDIPINTTFTIRLIEPCKGGFALISPREDGSRSKRNLGSGTETLRLRNSGPPVFEEVSDNLVNTVLERICVLLESFMGIHDNELAAQIWEVGKNETNPHDFVMAIESSDLQIFGFNEDLLFDLWGAIDDYNCGRIDSKVTS